MIAFFHIENFRLSSNFGRKITRKHFGLAVDGPKLNKLASSDNFSMKNVQFYSF